MRVVLDTNVLVSGIAKWMESQSAPPRILQIWDRGGFELGVSETIIRELKFALSKPYFQQHSDQSVRVHLINIIKSKAIPVDPSGPSPQLATHWQDDLILAAAIEFSADFLVTGDKELLAVQHSFAFRIIHPNEFLAILNADIDEEV